MTRFVRPVGGLVIRLPISKHILPASGGVVQWTGQEGKFWQRQLRDGSIEIVEKVESVPENVDIKKDFQRGKK